MAELEPGVLTELAPGVCRLLAPNAGLMTGPGTNTYLLGRREVAVLDPGPAIERHIRAIVDLSPGKIRWIVVTHTHPDHSPAAAGLAGLTGAELVGVPAPAGESQDRTFAPARVPADGEHMETPEFTLRAVTTPGHASNHVCYRHEALRWLFTGDHIMNGSTVVINPPDGDMGDYLGSLAKLKDLGLVKLAPGHGELIDDPDGEVDALIAHRLEREAKTMEKLAAHSSSTLGELVVHVYDEVDPKLHSLAERLLLAHLLKLERDGAAARRGDRWSVAV